MGTLNMTDLSNATALTAAALNDRFNAIQGLLNGKLTPDNLATSQIHIPFLHTFPLHNAVAYTSGAIIARPVSVVGPLNLTLKLLSAWNIYSGAGSDIFHVWVEGYSTFADAITNTGPTLFYDQTLTSGVLGWYGAATTATVDITGGAYSYLRVAAEATFGGAGTKEWSAAALSGELVYTIQAT